MSQHVTKDLKQKRKVKIKDAQIRGLEACTKFP